MNISNNLSRAGWVLIVRRPELSFETYELKVKEVIFLDPSVMVTDMESIIKNIKEKDEGGIKMEFQLMPLVQATSEEIGEHLNKLVSVYNETNQIYAKEFTVTAGEIIPL
jgi:hypothetical protein